MTEYLLPILVFSISVVVIAGYLLKQRLSGASGPGTSDPRRLARLLVTEVKLYNDEAVEKARQTGAIDARLRGEIERARQVYEERTLPETRGSHFDEALVEILAGSDSSLLGSR